MSNTREKGIVFTVQPNEKQIKIIQQTFGCVRFVYNHFLDMRNTLYKYTRTSMNYSQMSADLTVLKQEKPFLKSVDKCALQNACKHLDDAFDRFFKKTSKYPRFKNKRKSKKSYKTNFTNNNIEVNVDKKLIKLPKLGWMPFVNRCEDFAHKILNATITQRPNGTYTVSITVQESLEKADEMKMKYSKEELEKLLYENQVIAGDLGIRMYLTCSNGTKIENPKHLDRALIHLGRQQRKLSRMIKGSKNYLKQQRKIAKIHAYISHARKDFLHQLSHTLTKNYQIIILEDLHVKGLIRNPKLSRLVQDASWGTFKTMIQYKALWRGKTSVFVNQWFPSSKLCSKCNVKNTMLTLSDETWICPNCDTHHQRDENASYNLTKEGLRLLA